MIDQAGDHLPGQDQGEGGQARLGGACRRLSARTGEGMGNMSVIY